MIAWKVDDLKLSILVKTDVKYLTQLVFATFVQNQLLMNDRLTLTRIQTVDVDGTPQEFNQVLSHSKKDLMLRTSEILSEDEWKVHLNVIESLGVLANQASEYEIKKNLTEGKTGIVQPDLIPSKSVENVKKVTSPSTPKKSLLSLEKTDEKIQALRRRSHSNIAELVDEKSENDVKSPTSPKFPVSPAKSVKKLDESKFPTLSSSAR